MAEDQLLQENRGSIRILKINRPKALNALNVALIEELHREMQVAESTKEVRVIVLTGTGDRAFAAGADITELEAMPPLKAQQYSRRGQDLMQYMESMSIPVIAAVNGYAFGGGLELALACDFIYAAESARFGLVEADLGLIPGYGGVARLARRIGEAAAREALYTAQRFSAQESLRLGLVNRVVADESLLDEVLEVGSGIAQRSPASIQILKSLLNSTRNREPQTIAELESQAFGLTFSDADGQEGIRAFMEKRNPVFSSQREL